MSSDETFGDVSVMKLSMTLGPRAKRVLGSQLKPLPRVKGKPQQYRLLKPLPTKEEYVKLENEYCTTTVENLIEDGYSDLESLKDELQDWYDNLPEQFQSGDKGETLQTGIDELENVERPNVDAEHLNKLPSLVYKESLKLDTRSDRFFEAKDKITTAKEFIEGELETLEEGEYKDYLGDLVQELEEVEGIEVEFPGFAG